MTPMDPVIGAMGDSTPVREDSLGPYLLVNDGTRLLKIKVVECSLCGAFELDDPYRRVKLDSSYVCAQCADAVMNLWHKAMSGSYITWQNPPNPSKAKAKISPGLRRRAYERDSYACRYCGARRNLTLDHVHPESRGGETDLDNLVTACFDCNIKKGTQTPDEAQMTLHPPEAFA